MNMVDVDGYEFWRGQLAGLMPEVTKGQPQAGYYRNRYTSQYGDRKKLVETGDEKKREVAWEAIAFWWEDDALLCARSKFGDGSKMQADEIDELFGSCCRYAVSYEAYTGFLETGKWPEDISEPEVSTVDENGVEKSPDVIAAEKLAATQAACKAWLVKIGHKPETQEEADKAANYADAFAKIETTAERSRKAEKEPHLEAGRAVYAKWKLVVDPASKAKTWAKGLSADFIEAEKQRRIAAAKAENDRLQAEYAAAKAKSDKEAAEAAALAKKLAIEAPPVAEAPAEAPREVVAEPVKVGTGARRMSAVETQVWEVVDFKSLFHWIADRNAISESLQEEARKFAARMCEDGVEVPGMALKTKSGVR